MLSPIDLNVLQETEISDFSIVAREIEAISESYPEIESDMINLLTYITNAVVKAEEVQDYIRDSAYDEGFSEGYQDCESYHSDDYDTGHRDGYEEGYSEGYSEGFETGKFAGNEE